MCCVFIGYAFFFLVFILFDQEINNGIFKLWCDLINTTKPC
jgi:hypothetical protein